MYITQNLFPNATYYVHVPLFQHTLTVTKNGTN